MRNSMRADRRDHGDEAVEIFINVYFRGGSHAGIDLLPPIVPCRRRLLGCGVAVARRAGSGSRRRYAPALLRRARMTPKFPYHKNAPYTPDAATPEHLLQVHGRGRRRLRHRRASRALPGRSPLPRTLPRGREGQAQGHLPVLRRPSRLTEANDRHWQRRLPLVAARIHAYDPDRLPPFGKPELRALWKAAGDAGTGGAAALRAALRARASSRSSRSSKMSACSSITSAGRFRGPRRSTPVVLRWSKYPTRRDEALGGSRQKVVPTPRCSACGQATDRGVRCGAPDVRRRVRGGGSTGASYKAERERIAGLLAHLSDADRAKIFGGTAAKIMGFRL